MNRVLVSDFLAKSLCEQIAHEQYNARLYMFICGVLRNKGLDNLAKKFEEQQKEETGHSMEFFNLMTDLNADVSLPALEEINIPVSSIFDIAIVYLEREILTTKSIDELKKLAMDENSPVVEEKMRYMISLQQKEYEEATSFMDNASLCMGGNDSWWKAKVWNDSLR